MTTAEHTEALAEAARDAYRRKDWVAARDGFRKLRQLGDLSADDIYCLATAAWWLGKLDEAQEASAVAYRLYLQDGKCCDAALSALNIAYTHSLRGEAEHASGWMSRALRALRDEPECIVHGYLMYMDFEEALDTCDFDLALERALEVQKMGRRFESPTLGAIGVLAEGRTLIKTGRVRDGLALLDEAMLAALSEDLDPDWGAGNIYCNVMAACHELADFRRAAAWTEATSRWCESMPAAGPFMGICRIHRSRVFERKGSWDEAEREAARACEESARSHIVNLAEGRYQIGEIRRLCGDLAGAEDYFSQARQLGRNPQPGLALLRLAQGRTRDALASIETAFTEQDPEDRLVRARLCAARVEVALAAREIAKARASAEELEAIAHAFGSSGLIASSSQATGAVLLAEQRPAEALAPLRAACNHWQELDAPYDAARVHLLLAGAYDALGDGDEAAMERDAATALSARLGTTETARPTVAGGRGGHPDGLTAREAEVLTLAATGMSNSDIAESLVLSVRTVERHLATVYQKLGLQGRNARAAAVSYAHREGMLRS